MEASTGEQMRREENYLPHSPCHLCRKLVSAFLKCLGFDTTSPEQATHPPPQEESDMREELARGQSITIRKETVRRRPPPRPPVSSGGGGQIN